MSFRKLRGVPLTYNRQGMVYFTCKNYYALPQKERQKIDKLCDSAAGAYSEALKELLTSETTVPAVAMMHNVSEMTLVRCRKRFYAQFFQEQK